MKGADKRIRKFGLFLLVMAFIFVREGSPAWSDVGGILNGRDTAGAMESPPTAVVEFRLGERTSRALIFTRRKAWSAILPSRERVERSVRGFIRAVGRSPENSEPVLRAARRIASEILPFEHELAGLGVERLILVPEGILTCLAFEALRTDGASGRGWLVEKYAISYAPPAFLFMRSGARPAATGALLLAAGEACPGREKAGVRGSRDLGPLSYVQTEILGISRLFPGRCRHVHQDRTAGREDFLKHRSENFQVIHFAGHGRCAGRPKGSTSLVLSPGKGSGGDLSVDDIRGCGISAELVVLSACETAAGPPCSDGGIDGLPRAFLRENVRSVVATLWPVPDRTTAEFMAVFYTKLKSGLGKSDALRSAKRRMIRRGLSHPFYWAGFVLFGEPAGRIDFAASEKD